MGYLGVKNEITYHIVLANQGTCILTEIVEDLHHIVGFHYVFESKHERVDSNQIYQEALVGIVNLQ